MSAQLLHYQFNEGVGAAAANSGSLPDSLILQDTSGAATAALWGASGSGTSASATDRALDVTSASGMGSGFSGPNAFLSSLSPVTAIDQFTISGWFRPSSTDLARASFLTIQNGANAMSLTGLSGGPAGARNRLRLIIDFPTVDAVGAFEAEWSTFDAWALFAITYDGQSAGDRIKFYSGSLGGEASLSASRAASSILFPLGGASLWIGSDPSHGNPFRGYIDDIRLYDSALTALQIEQVRLSAVPEASSAALLILGALVLLQTRRSS